MITQGVLTLSGAAQRLVDALSNPTGVAPAASDIAPRDVPCRTILLQADSANTHVVNVGDANITSSLYGLQIPIPVTSIPASPIGIQTHGQSSLKPSDVYVIGTAGEKLRFILVDF